MKKRILITGGQGFIGSHLTRRALENGWKTTVLSLNRHDFPIDLPDTSNLKQVYADLTNRDEVRQVLVGEKFHYVINCAGYINHQLFRDGGEHLISQHLSGVMNLVAVLDRSCLESFVQVGSSDEYGNQSSPLTEDLREQPISPYSFGKTGAAHFLKMLHISENFPATIVRFFLVYGPGQDTQRFLPQIIKGCLEDQSFPTSEGKQLRDFCYVEDIVDGIFKMLESSAARGELFNLASGKPVTIRSMIERVRKLIGKGNPEFGKFPYRPGENMSLYADISKAKNLLNWEPKTDMETGLSKTIAWIKGRG